MTETAARERSLARVREMVLAALADRPVAVWLVGSMARGTATRGSDIDVAVSAGCPLPAGVLAALRERLEESTIPYRVDVVDLATVDAETRRDMLEGAVPWRT